MSNAEYMQTEMIMILNETMNNQKGSGPEFPMETLALMPLSGVETPVALEEYAIPPFFVFSDDDEDADEEDGYSDMDEEEFDDDDDEFEDEFDDDDDDDGDDFDFDDDEEDDFDDEEDFNDYNG